MSWNDGIGRLVRVEQEIGRHHDGGEHVVEIVRDAAGELADRLHLLRLRELRLQLALLGGLDRVDDRRLAVALLLLDRRRRRTAPSARPRPRARRRPARCRPARPRPCAIAASSAARSRSATTARIERPSAGSASPLSTPCCRRANSALARAIVPLLSTVAIAIGVLWKKRMKRTSAARCGSAPSSRARLSTSVREAPGAPSAANATLWYSRTGTVRPPRVFRSRSKRLGLHFARRRRRSAASSAAPSPATMSASFSPPEPTCGQIVVEPARERRVEIDDLALGIDREEAGRRVIEIVDRVLQFLEDVLLPLAVARDVGDRPDGPARIASRSRCSGRTRKRSQRAGRRRAPGTRTSSCSRRPSREALARR